MGRTTNGRTAEGREERPPSDLQVAESLQEGQYDAGRHEERVHEQMREQTQGDNERREQYAKEWYEHEKMRKEMERIGKEQEMKDKKMQEEQKERLEENERNKKDYEDIQLEEQKRDKEKKKEEHYDKDQEYEEGKRNEKIDREDKRKEIIEERRRIDLENLKTEKYLNINETIRNGFIKENGEHIKIKVPYNNENEWKEGERRQQHIMRKGEELKNEGQSRFRIQTDIEGVRIMDSEERRRLELETHKQKFDNHVSFIDLSINF